MIGGSGAPPKRVVLVGNPNVGKSVLFRLLTGRYAVVSNFPGTTVEVARGRMDFGGSPCEVIDTPGINSLLPQSEEEQVTCEILLKETPDVIVQVADAKNLRRTLLVTSQLVEFGVPMVLVLNMMDEVEDRGIVIDTRAISNLFGIALVEMVAIYRHGVRQLITAIGSARIPENPLRSGRWVVDSLAGLNGDCGPLGLAIEWLGHGERRCILQAEKSLGPAFVSRLKEITGEPQGHVGHASSSENSPERGRRSTEAVSKLDFDSIQTGLVGAGLQTGAASKVLPGRRFLLTRPVCRPASTRLFCRRRPSFSTASPDRRRHQCVDTQTGSAYGTGLETGPRIESSTARIAAEIGRRRNELLDWAGESFKQKKKKLTVEPAASPGTRAWLVLLAVGIVLFAWNEIGGLFHSRTPYSWMNDLITNTLAGPSEPVFTSRGVGLIHSVLFATDDQGKAGYGLIHELNHFFLIIAPVLIPFAVLLKKHRSFAESTGVLMRRPLTGIPILVTVLLLIYEFVGYTGAQTLVGLIEETLFGRHLVPLMQSWIPRGFFHDLLVGKYGLVSMGLTYSLAIVLPVVATFFIAFSLLEDSGYLPRLTVLSDRVMRWMGLNGKATLPMILGLGCCTMATMTTRILTTRKERLIATVLLALGVPCSAQLGVILGVASGFSPMATLTIIGVVVSQLFIIGFLASKLIRGERSGFVFEIPPIRLPQLKNVALKTGYRILWYLKEAVPLFLYGTFALFLLDKWRLGEKSLLQWIEFGLEPVIKGMLHLPSQAASVFVLGFLRRDYGAAGLFEMVRNGTLSAQQAVVSLIVITLFVPCLASFLVIVKEQGMKWALAIVGFILPFAIVVGMVVSWSLRTLEITFR